MQKKHRAKQQGGKLEEKRIGERNKRKKKDKEKKKEGMGEK